jgi:hypothetical protein
VEETLERLAPGDQLGSVIFDCGHEELTITHAGDWFERIPTDPAPAWLEVPGMGTFQLTHQAAKQIGSTARIPVKLQEFLPADTLGDAVNFALRKGLGSKRALKLLTFGQGGDQNGERVPLAVAQCRDTITPFSDVKLLETVLKCIRARFGDEAADSAVIDYKFWRDLEHTSFRVVIPAVQAILLGTGEEDVWCFGIEVRNSLTAMKQTTVSGYLFRFASTAGCLDIEHASGGFPRRGSTPEGAFAWTAEACRDIFGGVEAAFNGLQELVKRPMVGDYSRVLRQLFKDNGVAKVEQLRVISALEDFEGGLTMYDLMNAGIEAANLDDLGWRQATALMLYGGDILHRGGGLCDGSLKHGCRRLLPEDWDQSEAALDPVGAGRFNSPGSRRQLERRLCDQSPVPA